MSHAHLRSTAFLTAAAYGAGAVLELVRDQPVHFTSPVDYLIEGMFVAGLAGTVAVLVGLARAQHSGVTRAALGVAALGNAATLVAAAATLVLGRDVLGGVFMLGVLATILGYVATAVLDLFRRLHPRLAGVVLLLGFVGSVVVGSVLGTMLGHGGDSGTAGGIALAAAWVGVARLLAAPYVEVTQSTEVARA